MAGPGRADHGVSRQAAAAAECKTGTMSTNTPGSALGTSEADSALDTGDCGAQRCGARRRQQVGSQQTGGLEPSAMRPRPRLRAITLPHGVHQTPPSD